MSPDLIGRESERSRLDELLAAARDGRGCVVLVSGEAGVGCTSLVEAALAESGLVVRHGRAREDTNASYGPVAVALRHCLSREELPDCGPLGRYLSLLLPELGPAPDQPDPEVLPEAILGAFLALAHRAPLALFLDDLQWADNATLEWIPCLAERLASEPMILLAAYRGDEIDREHPLRRLRASLRRARVLEEIHLEPLDEDATGTLLARCLPGKPAESLARLVHEKTHGLPLYVEQLAGALVSGRLLRETDDGLELIPGEDVPVPETIRDAIHLRLDSLPEPAREALEIAAVCGMDFDLELIEQLAGDESGVEALLAGALVTEAEPGVGSFRQALVREAIRAEIPWSRRRSLHRRVATYLDRRGAPPEEIAEHWLAAREHEPARVALLSVADRACRIHAYLDAVTAARRALAIWPEGELEEERLATLQRLAECAQLSGRTGDAVKARREVADSPITRRDPERRAEAMRALADTLGSQGSWEPVIEARAEAARLFEESGRLAEAAQERLAIGGRLTALNALDRALEVTQEAAALAGRAERTDLVVRAKGAQGNLLAMRGEAKAGRELAQEALSLALDRNLRDAAAEAYRRLASVLDYSSDFAGSRDAYATAVEYCESSGDRATSRICLGCTSFIVFRTGEWKRALEVCRQVQADPESPPGSRSIALGIQGIIRAKRGETRGAKTKLHESFALAQRCQATIMEMVSRHGQALVAEFEGDVERAAVLHEQVLGGWRATQDRHDLVPVFLWQSTFFGRQGRAPEASERAAVLTAMGAGLGNPETDAARAHALGEVALVAGDTAEAVRQFELALAGTEKLEIPLEMALTSWRAGVALARNGDRDTAVDRLVGAYRATRNLGARPIAALISEDLRELGEDVEEGRLPDEARRADRAGLTRRQIEIVRLVAEGLTNKEIAKKLFVSPRTVDMHVSNALDRLDCRSRTEAARKVAEMGLLD